MSAHAYTEDQFVERPVIGLFAELGWQTVSALEETFSPPSPGLAVTLLPCGAPSPVPLPKGEAMGEGLGDEAAQLDRYLTDT